MLVVLLATVTCACRAVNPPVTLNPQTRRLQDALGRERYYHGVNVVYKSPPYFPIFTHYDPQLSFSEQDAQYLNAWGLNIIRLGTQTNEEWPGVETAPGVYSSAYLDKIAQIIEIAYAYNISVLLDMHQDSLSRVFCGEGIPGFYVDDSATGSLSTLLFDSFPMPLGPPFSARNNLTREPTLAECAEYFWADYQFTFAGAEGYQMLYQNARVRERFGKFWRFVAARFAAAGDMVIGYELLNEPFCGNLYEDPALLEPDWADRANLQPFYDEIVAGHLRKADKAHLVFFEPVTWSDLPLIYESAVGFEHAPGGARESSRSVLSFHYYSVPNVGNMAGYFGRRLQAAEALGVGAMVTEFDIETSQNQSATQQQIELMANLSVSWIGWQYKSFAGSLANGTCTGCGPGPINPNGTLNYPVISTLSRTYATAVYGTLQTQTLDADTLRYQLVFAHRTPDASTPPDAPTVIYANEQLHYPSGVSCTASVSAPGATAQCLRLTPNYYSVFVAVADGARAAATPSLLVTVDLQAA